MERSLPMRGRKRPKSPHPAIIPESSRFGLVALAVTLLFLWAALTQQTILRLHHSTHTGLRSGGLNLHGTAQARTVPPLCDVQRQALSDHGRAPDRPPREALPGSSVVAENRHQGCRRHARLRPCRFLAGYTATLVPVL